MDGKIEVEMNGTIKGQQDRWKESTNDGTER